MKDKLLIAIPCYNCEKQVQRVLKGLVSNLDTLSPRPETILFIDNGSSDATVKKLQILKEDLIKNSQDTPLIRIIRNDSNYGLGGSHKIIFHLAVKEDYDWVTILHGDDQASISDIAPLTKRAITTHQTTLGSRFLKDSVLQNYQTSRIIGNRVLNSIFSVVTKETVTDLGSGLNIFKVEDLKKLDLLNLPDSFNFNCELLLELFKKSIKPQYFPITWSELDQVSNARNFSVAQSMLKSLMRWKFNLKKSPNLSKSLETYSYKEL